MNVPLKTPVSVLQELCVKRDIIPAYQDSQNSGLPHAPCFLCEVICSEHIAQGQGRTKKEAKHAAAEKMLKILTDDAAVASPHENKLKENAVGALTDYCDEYLLPTPQYEFVREEGPGHNKRFTERCFVGSFATETTERSKKQAKQVVALQMITMLKDTIDPRVSEDIRAPMEDLDEDFQAALTKFRNCELVFNMKFERGDLSSPIMDEHFRYFEYYAKLKDCIDEFTASETENPEVKLSSLMEKMEIKYSLMPVHAKNPKASRNAAIKALRYIRILSMQQKSESQKPTGDGEFQDLIGSKK